jgi:hypothetical protein
MLRNTINSIDDYITGEKFYQFADMIYSPDIIPEFDDYNLLENTFDISKLEDINTVYTHTLYVKHLFETIKDLAAKFIIITHNSDINIDNSFHIPKNVIKWYAQNKYNWDTRITPIPIGLENERWYKETNKKQKMFDILKTEKKIKNLAYMNHNVKTYPPEREYLYTKFSQYTYIDIERGINGQLFERYVDNVYNHDFVFAPRGNGIDTHRIWECLYMNTIPIVKRNHFTAQLKDLPICIVDDWCEINRDFLLRKRDEIYSIGWNYEKLKIDYWRDEIEQRKNIYRNSLLQS